MILVTGASGFIGRHVVKKLIAENIDVIGIDIVKNTFKHNNYSFMQLDLTKECIPLELLNTCTHIIHLASIVGVSNVLSCAKNILTYNIDMLDNIIKSIKLSNTLHVIKIIFTSTSEVYNDTLYNNIESFPMQLRNTIEQRFLYANSKLCQERILASQDTNNIEYLIIRPFNIVGPRPEKWLCI